MAILVDAETRLVVQGLTGSEGRFHGLRNRSHGTNVVAGVTPGKGGQDVEGIPVFDTVAAAVAETGANTAMVFVPAPFAADAMYESIDAGIATVICITEGVPAHEMLRLHAFIQASRCAPDRAELPRSAIPREGQRRDHSGRDLPRGLGRARVALGDADLPDRARAHAARARELDDRRDRRRPDRRLVVPRDAGAVRGRPADRAGGHGGRDRWRRGGEGRRLHRDRDDEACRRLHRRLHGAARQDHGARRRDHLRVGGNRAGEEGRARGARDPRRHDADGDPRALVAEIAGR